ncbi:DUF4260 domain-containing protein [Microvirga roseola]|uniref:DUF4260 domain-containing protein n=1 Tax=Microvirga roseola TaxID=2883126 RepID=UPI001E367DEE|nr:DUF4260 domain-containing protein [Microvirga roseola]
MDGLLRIPAVAGAPRLLLRLEGAALLALATAGFALTGLSWWLYALLFFLPDLSFAAYMAGPRPGAAVYNALHSTIGPAVLAGVGLLLNSPMFLGLAAIWAAHIGFDRMLGYGLKYASAFGDTHLGRIGRASAGA